MPKLSRKNSVKRMRKNSVKRMRKNSRSSRKMSGGRQLNEYFKLMLSAKKSNKPFFMYKNKKYVGRKHQRLGMIYKKQ